MKHIEATSFWQPCHRLFEAAVAKPVQRGPAGPALDVKSGLSLEVVTGKARGEKVLKGIYRDVER